MLRFFENKRHEQTQTGVYRQRSLTDEQRRSSAKDRQPGGLDSGEAAQKRVNSAVERLREFFAKRGVTVGASGLVVFISANAVKAAPVALAAKIAVAAIPTGLPPPPPL